MKSKVLLVDDDRDIRDALSMSLRAQGYVVETASDGVEALECLRANAPPHVILLDLMMPVMNGWEFRLEQLKDEQLAKIPVIIVSADCDALKAARELETAAVLRKPFEMSALLALLARHAV